MKYDIYTPEQNKLKLVLRTKSQIIRNETIKNLVADKKPVTIIEYYPDGTICKSEYK